MILQVIYARSLIIKELEGNNSADDNFNERLINILHLASNAHQKFLLSTTEEKRKLIKLVFSTVKLDGQKLVYTLRSPFDAFVKTTENGEWLSAQYTLRTLSQGKLSIMIINTRAFCRYNCF